MTALETAAPVDLSMPVADDFAVARALKAPEAVLEAGREPAGQRELSSVAGLTLREAEDLLDWLHNQGCTGLEAALGEGGVTVRCVCPPGLRLERDEGGAVCLAWG
jgi:hypothetical protein